MSAFRAAILGFSMAGVAANTFRVKVTRPGRAAVDGARTSSSA